MDHSVRALWAQRRVYLLNSRLVDFVQKSKIREGSPKDGMHLVCGGSTYIPSYPATYGRQTGDSFVADAGYM